MILKREIDFFNFSSFFGLEQDLLFNILLEFGLFGFRILLLLALGLIILLLLIGSRGTTFFQLMA